ncbi:MAG: nucleoside-diphosphate kinase [Candidatus Marinimicrobia bacterium]|nr:nucleoside-diphosphate kinase [Candidatus Neomarinimicrobiota bacterium]
MGSNRTLAIIKPDAIRARTMGKIIDRILEAGLEIRAARLLRLTKARADEFYAIHRGKPFFDELTTFMSSGPCFPMALEREEAVEVFRTLIGATDPAQANTGTLRKDFATSVGENAVHGSDSDEDAQKEVAFFFTPEDILGHL